MRLGTSTLCLRGTAARTRSRLQCPNVWLRRKGTPFQQGSLRRQLPPPNFLKAGTCQKGTELGKCWPPHSNALWGMVGTEPTPSRNRTQSKCRQGKERRAECLSTFLYPTDFL